MKRPQQLQPTLADIEALLARVEQGALLEGDYEIIKSLAETVLFLGQVVDEKETAIRRLLRLIFGARTESRGKLFKNEAAPGERTTPEKQPSPGHGKNGADAYPGAARVSVPHESLKAGDPCPECPKGKVYPVKKPGMAVRFLGIAPLQATIYSLEKLRCNLCGVVLTAPPPAGVGEAKYDETAAAMIALLKYGSGLPFHRIERLQENVGIALPASTQWDIVEHAAGRGCHAAYRELVRQAAQGDVIHNDDTNMKVLALMKNAEEKAARTGMFTTGMVSLGSEGKIALFFTGQQHAGENLRELLAQRQAELQPPIQMCDALSRNVPEPLQTIVANCLVHGRRNFVDIAAQFPDEARHVIDRLAVVYQHDKTARDGNLSAQERLLFHQEHSGPVMKELKGWLSAQLEQKQAEPNSSLGKAIAYMLRHWDALTLFLRVPGAPLDNSLCERVLKKAILHRKNSLFYKSEHGAFIGDLFMSLIQTCNLHEVNPFDYLIALQRHAAAVRKVPGDWMPWNYRQNIPANDS